MRRYLSLILLNILSVVSVTTWASAAPLFAITPLVQASSPAVQGQTVIAIYQVYNNTPYSLTSLNVTNFPAGISQITTTDISYCNSSPFSLAPGASCLLKVQINTSLTSTFLQWNPQICIGPGKIYCGQAYPSDQVAMTISPGGPIPTDCTSNQSNFDYELAQQLDNGSVVTGWGISPIAIQSNLNSACAATTSWQQARVLAAADFWVSQKINYCHHYMPDWKTPVTNQCSAYAAGGAMGGCCSFEPNLDPSSPLYNQVVRWNYSGQNSETVQDWQTFGRMWYGLDCTNYTRLLYNFAFGTLFTGDTPSQAGQDPDGSQSTLSPNQQVIGNELDYSCSPGILVCGDGSMDTGNFCVGHGGQFAAKGLGNYFSIIDTSGVNHNTDPTVVAMVRSQLSLLQPGDIVYIAGDLDTGNPSPNVTHAVMWTGKTVGYNSGNILPTQVAPDQYCTASVGCSWKGADNMGGYVITDSHYQGADYRVFTDFFYLEDLWGVRRIIGSSGWPAGTNCHPPD